MLRCIASNCVNDESTYTFISMIYVDAQGTYEKLVLGFWLARTVKTMLF